MDAETPLDAAVGSVAEEATRLLEALGRPQVPARAPVPATGEDQASGAAAPGAAAGDAAAPDAAAGNAPPEPDDAAHVHVAMGDAETCSWCPVCRSVGVLRSVSPETLARLADLATAAATVLADLAGRQAEQAGGDRREPADRSTRTEPITVVDEEELS